MCTPDIQTKFLIWHGKWDDYKNVGTVVPGMNNLKGTLNNLGLKQLPKRINKEINYDWILYLLPNADK